MLLDKALGDSPLYLLWPLPAASVECSQWFSGRGDDSAESLGVTAVDPERIEWVQQSEVHGKITGVCKSGEFTGARTFQFALTIGDDTLTMGDDTMTSEVGTVGSMLLSAFVSRVKDSCLGMKHGSDFYASCSPTHSHSPSSWVRTSSSPLSTNHHQVCPEDNCLCLRLIVTWLPTVVSFFKAEKIALGVVDFKLF